MVLDFPVGVLGLLLGDLPVSCGIFGWVFPLLGDLFPTLGAFLLPWALSSFLGCHLPSLGTIKLPGHFSRCSELQHLCFNQIPERALHWGFKQRLSLTALASSLVFFCSEGWKTVVWSAHRLCSDPPKVPTGCWIPEVQPHIPVFAEQARCYTPCTLSPGLSVFTQVDRLGNYALGIGHCIIQACFLPEQVPSRDPCCRTTAVSGCHQAGAINPTVELSILHWASDLEAVLFGLTVVVLASSAPAKDTFLLKLSGLKLEWTIAVQLPRKDLRDLKDSPVQAHSIFTTSVSVSHLE